VSLGVIAAVIETRSTARNRPALAKSCPICEGKKIGIGKAENRKADNIYPYYCLNCRHIFSVYASKIKAERHALRCGELEILLTVTQRWISEGKIDLAEDNCMQPCVVCGTSGSTELHHWAPKHLFGLEAYKWPTANLCRACHLRWHKTVTPKMSK
jgi:hypothetical protein